MSDPVQLVLDHVPLPTTDLYVGDALAVLRTLPSESVHCMVTSPPYLWMRSYDVDGQIGLELTLESYLDALVSVFREARRVLRRDGTLWCNVGDTSIGSRNGGIGTSGITSDRNHRAVRAAHEAMGGPRHRRVPGLPRKSLIGVPWRLAFALQKDGWILRSDIIWHKPNPMPESVHDRPSRAHEHVFLFSKRRRYYYDTAAIREPLKPKTLTAHGTRRRAKGNDAHGGVKSDNLSRDVPLRRPRLDEHGQPWGANKRDVWTIASQPFHGEHFATFPEKLVEPCVLAGCPRWGTVLDPFGGSGRTALVANRLGRHAVLIELNPKYAAMATGELRAAGLTVFPRDL